MTKSVWPTYSGPHIQFIPGVPAVPHLGISDKEAAALVATGAFTYTKPPPEPKPIEDTEARQDGGSPDSQEA